VSGGLEVQRYNYPDWRLQNPEQAARTRQKWLDAHPSYYANYIQERAAVTDALIFQFLDNGFGGGTLEEFITFLRGDGVSEKHIGWFKADVKKELEKREKEKKKGLKPQITQISTDEDVEGGGC